MAGHTYTGTYAGSTTSLTNPGTNNPVTVTGTFDTTNATAIYGGLDFPWTITNLGRIADTGSIGDGISLAAGGDVVNGASGSTAAYLLGGTSAGAAGLAIGPGAPATSATVANYGTIKGFYGVDLAAGLTGATLTDAGTIIGTGGTAVLFGGGGDRMVLDPGAVLQGIVQAGGNAASDTLELASGDGAAGTLSGLGTSFTNFASITVDAGAQWQLAGANTIGLGVTLGDAGTLTNAGILSDAGVLLVSGLFENTGSIVTGYVSVASGGTLVNEAGGTIFRGVSGLGGGSIDNLGVILNDNGTTPISLQAGDRLTNGSSSDTTALIQGPSGITAAGAATILNYGSILGSIAGVGHAGAYLAGSSLTNASTGTIEGARGIVSGPGAPSTIANAGLVVGGTSSAGVGIVLIAGGTVIDSGTIIGNGGTAAYFGGSGSNRLALDPGAVLGGIAFGRAAATNTLELASGTFGSVGTLSNLGTSFPNFNSVEVDIGAQWLLQGSNTLAAGTTFDIYGTLAVAGTLSGTGISPTVTLSDGGAALNNTGTIGGEVYGLSSAYRVFVSNAGTILAGTSQTAAVFLADGGNVTNGGSGDTAALLEGPAGIEIKGTHEAVANYGTILGVSGLFGVYLAAGGSLTNASTGTIKGPVGVQGGVYPDQSTITNAGLIVGTNTFDPGIALFAGGTVIDSGTIIGGGSTAVALNGSGSNRLVLDPGAVLGGIAAGGTSATNTLELAQGDGAVGTLSGLGASFTNFSFVGVDIAAQWLLQGSNTAGAGTTFDVNGTLTVAGTLTGASASPAVTLSHGGASLNNTGMIGGEVYGLASAPSVFVSNAGTILAGTNQTAAVFLADGGNVTNGGSGDTTALIEGQIGVKLGGSHEAVANYGTILGVSGLFGVYLAAGGSLTNASTGTIKGAAGINAGGAQSSTITNAGLIAGSQQNGIALLSGGTVIDSGTITSGGESAVYLGGTGSNRLVLDPGAVLGGPGGSGFGGPSATSTLELAAGNGNTGFVTLSGFTNFTAVTVDPGATWELAGAQTIGAGTLLSIGGTLINAGTLTNAGTLLAAGGTLVNDGTLTNAGTAIDSGRFENFGSFGGYLSMASGGTLINEATGRFTGGDAFSNYGGGPADVTNFGTILGPGNFGVLLDSGGTVANLAVTGLIEAYYAVQFGQAASGAAAGTVINDGTIMGTGTNGEGVEIGIGQTATNAGTIIGNDGGVVLGLNDGGGGGVTNSGMIEGYSEGVFGAGTVVNSGTIQGFGTGGIGVELVTQPNSNPLLDKLVNAGVIMGNGGTAVDFDGSFANLLVDDPGAVFDGLVQGSTTGSNTLELAAGNGNTGTLSGFGTSFTNFGAITIDTGAQWSFAGSTTIGVAETLANAGTIVVANNETLEIDTTLGAPAGQSGTIAIGGKLLVLRGAVAAGQTIDFTDAAGTLDLADPAGFAGSITGFRPGDTLDLLGVAANQAVLRQGTLDVSENGTLVAALALSVNSGSSLFTATPSGADTIVTEAPCFGAGTRILTVRGEVAVEDLVAGDVAVTASGAERPIVWIGQRRVDCERHPHPELVRPVRIRAGAVAAGLPARDLWLSPDHAVFAEGVLIPVKYLRNGAGIAQQREKSVHYFHVELSAHDVLLAEGLPAESYLDTGNRAQFANGGAHIALYPDFSARSWDDACAPLCLAGPVVQAARRRLLARATETAELRVRAGGREFRPARIRGGLHCFLLPAGTREACVIPRAGPAPADGDGTLERIGAVLANGRPLPAERWRRTGEAGGLALPPLPGPVLLELLLRESTRGTRRGPHGPFPGAADEGRAATRATGSPPAARAKARSTAAASSSSGSASPRGIAGP